MSYCTAYQIQQVRAGFLTDIFLCTYAEKVTRKTSKDIQSSLTLDVATTSQTTNHVRQFWANLKSFKPAKRQNFLRTLTIDWHFA